MRHYDKSFLPLLLHMVTKVSSMDAAHSDPAARSDRPTHLMKISSRPYYEFAECNLAHMQLETRIDAQTRTKNRIFLTETANQHGQTVEYRKLTIICPSGCTSTYCTSLSSTRRITYGTPTASWTKHACESVSTIW